MKFAKEVVRKNRTLLAACLLLGIFYSFMAIFKVGFFQRLSGFQAAGTEKVLHNNLCRIPEDGHREAGAADRERSPGRAEHT